MTRTAYILLLATMLFWGGNAVAGKFAVGHVSPMLLTAMRWLFACAILYCIGHRQLRKDWETVRGSLPLLALLGFLGFTVFNVAIYTALLHTTAINTSLEQAGMPMLIFLLNFVLFKVRASALQMIGFTLSLVGVVLTATHGAPSRILELDVNFGDAIMLVGIVVYSVYTVLLRYKPPIHWMSFMIVLTGAAFLTSVPFVAGEYAADALIWPDATGWAVVGYTVIFPSIVSQIFYVRGVEMIGANRAGLFINMVPIFGTLLSIIILREAFQTYHAMAIALTLGGIALAEWSGRRMAANTAAPRP